MNQQFLFGRNHYGQRIAHTPDNSIWIREIDNIRSTSRWELELQIDSEYLYQSGSPVEIMNLFDALTH